MNIIFLVVFSILIALLSFFSVFVFIVRNKILDYEPILFFLELDLKKWRIKKSHTLLNNITSRYNKNFFAYVEKKMGNGWINISNLFNLFDEESEKKWHDAIEFCIQNKTDSMISQKLTIKSYEYRKSFVYFFSLKFHYINDEKINIECHSIEKMDNNIIKDRIITKNNLFDLKGKYKLFIAFSLDDTTSNAFISTVSQLDDILKNKNIKYFKSTSMVVLVLSSDIYKNIKKWNKSIKRKMKKYSSSKFRHYFDICTYVECQDLNTETDFSKVMTRVSFGLFKSKLQNEPIDFDLKNIKFNEFEEFKEKIITINNMIDSNDIEFISTPVTSIKSNKEHFDYYFPKIDLQDDYWNNYILQINDFDNKIKDNFIKNILNKKIDLSRRTLINVNDYQVEKILELMKKNKEFIYIVNRTKFKNVITFTRLLKLLDLLEIKYGLYVDNFDPQVLSIISNIKPKIIVLSDVFNLNFNNQEMKDKLKILNAIFITEHLNITLLFTNINLQMRKEIKLLSNKEKLFIQNSISTLF